MKADFLMKKVIFCQKNSKQTYPLYIAEKYEN